MKRALMSIAVACVLLLLLSPGRVKGGALGQDGNAAQAVRELDLAWGQAIIKRNAATLDRLLADNYVLAKQSGEIINKAHEIRDVKAPYFSFNLPILQGRRRSREHLRREGDSHGARRVQDSAR